MTSPPDDLSDFVNQPPGPKRSGRKFTLVKVLVVLGVIVILIGLFLPVNRSVGPRVRRLGCVSNLRQIALGLRMYESRYDALPPAYTVDPTGKPLHSWRTLILPFIDNQELYDTIDLSKPWDDPANAEARATQVGIYHCPQMIFPVTNTVYMAIVAPDGCFPPGKSRRLSEITDSHATTLTVIEVPPDQAVHWMAPTDADESSLLRPGPRSVLNHAGGVNAVFVDGSARFLPAEIPAALRRAMISVAGGEDIAKELE